MNIFNMNFKAISTCSRITKIMNIFCLMWISQVHDFCCKVWVYHLKGNNVLFPNMVEIFVAKIQKVPKSLFPGFSEKLVLWKQKRMHKSVSGYLKIPMDITKNWLCYHLVMYGEEFFAWMNENKVWEPSKIIH